MKNVTYLRERKYIYLQYEDFCFQQYTSDRAKSRQ